MTVSTENSKISFGKYSFDPRQEALYRLGQLIPLQEKPAKILKTLLKHPGEIVSRQSMIEALWADGTHVDFDNNLNASMRKLREALGDSASNALYVETIPRQGYRFVAPIKTKPLTSSTTQAKPFNPAPLFFALAAGMILVFLIAFFWPKPQPVPKTMLAFLPFKVLGDQPALEPISEGLSEELISQCGSLDPQKLGVIAGTSARVYRDSQKTVAEIGKELGVGFLVEGSLQQEKNQLRITTQLIRVSDQTQVWSKVYTRDMAQLFQLRREIGVEITQKLADTLGQSWQIPAETVLPRADYQNYLRARFHMNQSHATSFQKAVAILEPLVIQTPDFTHGSALLAEAYTLAAIYGGEPSETLYKKGEEVALLTLARDDKNALALTSLGYNALYNHWNWLESGTYFRQALTIAPGNAKVQLAAAAWYSVIGSHDEAVEAAERAKLLDPVSPTVNNDLAWYYYYAGQLENAMNQHQYMLDLNPQTDTYCAMLCHWALGNDHLAFDQVKALLPKDESIQTSFADAVAKGSKAANEWLVDVLLQSPVQQNRYLLANRQVALGQTEAAITTIKQAWQQRAPWAAYAPVDPGFQSLRKHPSFQALVASMDLPVVLNKGSYVPDPAKL